MTRQQLAQIAAGSCEGIECEGCICNTNDGEYCGYNKATGKVDYNDLLPRCRLAAQRALDELNEKEKSMSKEKKPLAVGDRVRVYGFDRENAEVVLTRSVVGVMKSGLLLTDNDEYVHPKQCRRLVRKPRREVTVIGFDNRSDGFYLQVDKPISIYCGLKLREVTKRWRHV